MRVMTLFDCLVSLFSGEKSDSDEISLPAHFRSIICEASYLNTALHTSNYNPIPI